MFCGPSPYPAPRRALNTKFIFIAFLPKGDACQNAPKYPFDLLDSLPLTDQNASHLGEHVLLGVQKEGVQWNA